MRRASICLAVLGLLALAVPAIASAEITVSITKFKAKAIPVPKPGGKGTWKGTGNILGAGAAVEAEYEFEGSGYGPTAQKPAGGIPPISQVNFFLPAGAKLHPAGFGQCTEATLHNIGPSGCPKTSSASPIGTVLGEVTFGAERVAEETELSAFFGEGGLLFYTIGHSPVSLEIVSKGKYKPSHQPPYGEELETLVPPVASVPGAPFASVKTIHIKAGAARQSGKKIISYGTLPTKCKGGLPVKTEVIFGGEYGGARNFGIPAITKTATYKAPCPRKH